MHGLYLQASIYPWDMALLDQELKRAQAERDAMDRAALTARWEREGLRRADPEDSPRRCCCCCHIRVCSVFSGPESSTPSPGWSIGSGTQ
ncbi:hypothetical protein LIER_27939 [Lithospermum erythrorhizon]|uniref:Uncharacterized protein n=1 Tax=Lithospermum erythrorhizon TaxID=34254 RepID=A0AAV3RHQ9_LITER